MGRDGRAAAPAPDVRAPERLRTVTAPVRGTTANRFLAS